MQNYDHLLMNIAIHYTYQIHRLIMPFTISSHWLITFFQELKAFFEMLLHSLLSSYLD